METERLLLSAQAADNLDPEVAVLIGRLWQKLQRQRVDMGLPVQAFSNGAPK